MLFEENLHISIRYIACELGVSYGTVNSIIHEELKMKKLYARWDSHQLSEEWRKLRIGICQENIDKLESGQ